MDRIPTFLGWEAPPPSTPIRRASRPRTWSSPSSVSSSPPRSPRLVDRSTCSTRTRRRHKTTKVATTDELGVTVGTETGTETETEELLPHSTQRTSLEPILQSHYQQQNHQHQQQRINGDGNFSNFFSQDHNEKGEEEKELEWERTYILQLCNESSFSLEDATERHRRWQEISQRLHQRPQVIQPRPLLLQSSNSMEHPHHHPQLYSRTILAALCSMDMSVSTCSSDEDDTAALIWSTIQFALNQCPWQVQCHQVQFGHTPLRDAVLNPTCLPQVLELLVLQQNNVTSALLELRDSDGLSPVDHLLHLLQLGPYADEAVVRLESLLKYAVSSPHTFMEDSTSTDNSNSNNHNLNYTQETDTCQRQDNIFGPAPSSPLLQLLSLGNSIGIACSSLSGAAATSPSSSSPSRSNSLSFFAMSTKIKSSSLSSSSSVAPEQATAASRRLDRVLRCTRLLLRWKPSLLQTTSPTTGCTPLHVAIRNYGNFLPLIREIAERSPTTIMQHRNRFGDLPIHVACSVGVPMEVLRFLLARSLVACSTSSSLTLDSHSPMETNHPHPWIWSRNNSGYTPVDLEWIRHIEAGHGFFTHRSFYPLDARGVRRPGGQYDDLYDVLLRQAVDQVIMVESGSSVSTASAPLLPQQTSHLAAATLTPIAPSTTTRATTENHHHHNNNNHVALRLAGANDHTVGLLLHRIFLLIRAAHRDSFSRSPHDLSGDILHQACALCGPHGPTLPRPVLELVLFQHPEQRERRDHAGKLPLHYAVQLQHHVVVGRRTAAGSRHCPLGDVSVKSGQEWKLWVQTLLCHAPEACDCRDHQGRLPLHYALEYATHASHSHPQHSRQHPHGQSEVMPVQITQVWPQEARSTIVKDLVARSPATLAVIDPVTKLYPYQVAGTNPLVSLDTVYYLLRRCPELISSC